MTLISNKCVAATNCNGVSFKCDHSYNSKDANLSQKNNYAIIKSRIRKRSKSQQILTLSSSTIPSRRKEQNTKTDAWTKLGTCSDPKLRIRHHQYFVSSTFLSSFILTLLVLFLPTTINAYSYCPNGCSGHGTCALPTSSGSSAAGTLATTLGLCTCDSGYEGPSCSRRPCPTGNAWFDAVSANNVAHRTGVICSGIGVCNDFAGSCSCPNGFTGDACQRQDCEAGEDKQCSGHGRCRSMFYIAENYGPQATTAAKLQAGPVYANWEKHAYRDCFCDWGYTGSRCQYLMCPKGDDPRTTGQNDLIFTITTSGTSGTALAGHFRFHFYGHSTKFIADAYSPTFSNANCQAFVQALSNVATATCAVSGISSNHRGATYTITITKYATIPYENNFFWHDGLSISTDYMACSIDDLTQGASPVCTIAITRASTKEYSYCSNRGTCDTDRGTCACFPNFFGINCQNEGTVFSITDSSSALTLAAESALYTGTLLSMSIGTSASTNFKFIDMKASGTSKFTVDGVGVLTMGGITVDTDGIVSTDGGASITKATNADVMSIYASQASFSNDVLLLSASDSPSTSFNAIHFIAGSGGTSIFKVKGDGAISTVANTATTSTTTGSIVTAGGIAAAKAIYAGGKIVTTDATDATSPTTGSLITAGGMGVGKRLTSTQLEVKNALALSSTTSAAYFRNSHSSFQGTVLTVESSMTSGSANYNLIQANINMDGTKALKFEVDGSGYVTAAGGANIVAGGLNVAAGGATVAAGGLTVSAGTIALTSTSAQAITHTGSSGNGLTISSGGGVTLAGAVIFGGSGCNCASSGGLDLKNAIPMRFDGATEDNYWLNLAVGAGPTGSTKTLTLPVGETGTILTDASTGSSTLTRVGVLTGLTVTGTTELSTTTGVTTVTNSRTSNFVGNLLQLDTAMSTATNAYNIILARSSTGGTAATQFKVDGTGKLTAAGGGVFAGSGMALAAGDITLTNSGAQAITHTGSGNNGLTISSGGGVTVSGAVTFGSSSYGVTIKNNAPLQFDGETEDSYYLILDVGNGPTSSSKTLSLPVDSNGIIIASASTLAVTIQSSNSDGVRVEAAKFVDNVITHGDNNNYLSLENVRFQDNAISTIGTLGMTSHLTNSGGNFLFTKGGDQLITKSGGGDLIITNSVSNKYVYVENWKFDGGDVTASGDISMDASSTSVEKLKCTENVCEHKSGAGSGNFISLEVVQFFNGAMSAITTISMSGDLTNSGGDFLFTANADQDITKSGSGDLIITNSVSNAFVHVENWKFNGGDVTSTDDITMDAASTSIEKFKCTENVCQHKTGDASGNFISVEVVKFFNGALSEITTLGMSGDLTNSAGDFKFTKSADQNIIKSGSGNLLISGAGALKVCVEDWCVNAGAVTAPSTHLTMDASSVSLEKFKCTENVCQHQTGDGSGNFISVEVVQFFNGAMSAITTLGMSGDLTNSAGNILFTKSGDQLITKSGSGDLKISGGAAVCMEDWCFTASAAASSGHMTMDGNSVSIELLKCTENECTHKTNGANDFLLVEDVKFQNGVISEVTSVGMSGDLTNDGGDILMTKSTDQSIIKSGGGNLIISGSAYVHIESWKFQAGAVTSDADLTIDANSVTIENMKCAANVCEHKSGAASGNFISLEVVQFFNGAMSAITTLGMSGDLTSAGDILLTKGGNQAITKSNSGNLVISNTVSNGAVQIESWIFTDGAVTSSGHITIDAASTTIENMKCVAAACAHKTTGNDALSLEDVSYVNGAMSGKGLVLDPNNVAGGAITITNSATQTSGSLVSITGTTNTPTLSIPVGDINFGNGKFVVGASGVETFGVERCAASLASSAVQSGAEMTCQKVVGILTIDMPTGGSGSIYPLTAGKCGHNIQLKNSKIASTSVVVMTVAEFAGSPALTGTVSKLTNAVTSNNELIFASDHGFAANTAVVYTDNSATSITALVDGTTYYVLAGTTDSKMKLAATSGGAAITIANGQGAAGNKITSTMTGIPMVLSGTVNNGAIDFYICNVGPGTLSGVVKVKFIVAGN